MDEDIKILQYFGYSHLPEKLQKVSAPFHNLAHALYDELPKSQQKSLSLQKLIESKDCAVRAMM